jgi:hypothetical protein
MVLEQAVLPALQCGKIYVQVLSTCFPAWLEGDLPRQTGGVIAVRSTSAPQPDARPDTEEGQHRRFFPGLRQYHR